MYTTQAVSDASSSSSSSADEAQSSEVRDGREGRSLQQQHTSPPRGVGGVASPRRRVGTRLHDGTLLLTSIVECILCNACSTVFPRVIAAPV